MWFALRQLLSTTFRLYKRGTGYCATYHSRTKKKAKKKIGHLICHQWVIRSCVWARRLFPEVTHCPFMSDDTHVLTDLVLVDIPGRMNTTASKCFHFSIFFFPSPFWVSLILLWLEKSPPAVEAVRQLALRQRNDSGVSSPRVTGQILNDDRRQCARWKKKVNRQAEKKVGCFPELFSQTDAVVLVLFTLSVLCSTCCQPIKTSLITCSAICQLCGSAVMRLWYLWWFSAQGEWVSVASIVLIAKH